jgi:hypothetical protein
MQALSLAVSKEENGVKRAKVHHAINVIVGCWDCTDVVEMGISSGQKG